MANLQDSILELVKKSDGIKASEIARILNIERAQVNSILYGKLRKECKIDSKYYWRASGVKKTDSKTNSEKPVQIDMR